MSITILALLDACDAARADTDQLCARSGDGETAAAAHEAAIAREEAAIEACVAELRRLEPGLGTQAARGMVAIPAYRARVRAIYATNGYLVSRVESPIFLNRS